MSEVQERPTTGASLALEVVNTAWGVGELRVDWLDDDAAVVQFNEEYGTHIDIGDVDHVRSSLTTVRDLLWRLFTRQADDDLEPALLNEVNYLLSFAHASVASPHGIPRISLSSPDKRRAVSIQALVDGLDLLQRRGGRIRSCHADDCTLWFDDTSKAGRRRWCSMERCGNRAKAHRHYERTKS